MDAGRPVHGESTAAEAEPSLVGASHTSDPYAALRFRDYRLLVGGRVLGTIGEEMLRVAVGWELYERTRSALALGLVGLMMALPSIGLALPAGHVADRFDRRRVVMLSQLLVAASSVALAITSWQRGPVPLIYLFLLLGGVGYAFNGPARAALLPLVVPRETFANAVTWNTTAFQVAAAAGPALGGLTIALTGSATPAYLLDGCLALGFVVLLSRIAGRPVARARESATLRSLLAGLGFVRRNTIILGAITLDMFAVLFGGATTLLPIFAKDILHVGPAGLGWLRAAPSMGALLMAVSLAYLPPMRRAGSALLWAVAGFGAATVVFGLSRSFTLSIAILFITGALDNISVVIRQTLVQTRTPDAMRGRVSAVNGVFIDTSNELGGFESGATAALFGPVASVVGGGILTIAVVVAVARGWPELRALGPLTEG